MARMARTRGTFPCHGIIRSAIYLGFCVSMFTLNSGCEKQESANFIIGKPRKPIKVNVFRPEKTEDATKTASYFGKLLPSRSATLGFPVGGEVESIATARERFAAGAVIAELDATKQKEERLRLSNQLNNLPEGARSGDRGRQLETQLTELDRQIQQHVVTAPFDCMVDQALVSQGSLVGAKRPAISIVETATPVIEIDLPRRYASLIDPSESYVFLLEGESLNAVMRNRSFSESSPGNVRITFDIESDLSNIDFFLQQSVEARFNLPTGKSGFWLPLTSVQKNSVGLWIVLVVENVDDEQRVVQFPIEIADVRDDTAFVTGDLEDRLIVRDGIHRVVAGQIVEVNEVLADGGLLLSRSE